MSGPDWEDFEKAVARFLSALDKNATVVHDAYLPDIHSGRPRQRDVFVEAKVLGHFPVSILVSCKKTSRRINQQQIDAFHGELSSSEATLGLLYSHSGFTSGAIEKAKAIRRIHCCRLYRDEAPDLPQSLLFAEAYLCQPRAKLTLVDAPILSEGASVWNDVFQFELERGDGPKKILDDLVDAYERYERRSLDKAKDSGEFPEDWNCGLVYTDPESGEKLLEINIGCEWEFYKGPFEAHLLDGSYCFSNDEFLGALKTPCIDMQSTHPGDHWELLQERPARSRAVLFNTTAIRYFGDIRGALTKSLGNSPLLRGTN